MRKEIDCFSIEGCTFWLNVTGQRTRSSSLNVSHTCFLIWPRKPANKLSRGGERGKTESPLYFSPALELPRESLLTGYPLNKHIKLTTLCNYIDVRQTLAAKSCPNFNGHSLRHLNERDVRITKKNSQRRFSGSHHNILDLKKRTICRVCKEKPSITLLC